MIPFTPIYEMALERKGGEKTLQSMMPPVKSAQELLALTDDRCLSEMSRCVHQAGFSWSVIDKKWPEMEAAYLGFEPNKLKLLSDEQWEAYVKDARVVRSWQKIKAVRDNLVFILDVAHEHGSFAKWLAEWPADDQMGLVQRMKKHGARLGGMTGQRVLRNLGWDTYVLTPDVCAALRRGGAEVPENPSAQRDLKLAQAVFTAWHEETGLPYAHLSRIASCSIGQNLR